MKNKQQGFTLPELLVVSVVLIALLVVGSFAITSQADTAPRRDAQRRYDSATLVQAVNAYYKDNGFLPPSITQTDQFVGSGQGEADLCSELVPIYAKDLPFDPLSNTMSTVKSCLDEGGDYITGYSVRRDGDTVIVSAPFTETVEEIKVEQTY